MLSNREKLILKAIIDEYIETGEPVGSKCLTCLPYLEKFSSATLRADMANLEKLGYLLKTHTSSGRVPSEKGFRYYVSNLLTRNSDVLDFYPLIDEILYNNKFSIDKAIEKSLDLLSKLTNLTTFSLGSFKKTPIILKIDLISLTNNRALLLLVTDSGVVEKITLTLPSDINLDDLYKVVITLNDILKNKNINQASEILNNIYAKNNIKQVLDYKSYILERFLNALKTLNQDDFQLHGFKHFFDNQELDDISILSDYIEKMNEENLLTLLGDDTGLSVRFPSDIEFIPRNNATIISIPYKIDNYENGYIAIIGPPRMDYKKTIPLIEYIASALSKFRK